MRAAFAVLEDDFVRLAGLDDNLLTRELARRLDAFRLLDFIDAEPPPRAHGDVRIDFTCFHQ